MTNLKSHHGSASGQVAGSFLLGLVQSFQNLNSLPQGGMSLGLNEIDPAQWYPYKLLLDTLHDIEKRLPSKHILFRAGINFLRIWYENGPGKTMIHSGLDWLHANNASGGYNSVVRGGNRDEIGWCFLLSLDETIGIAVYENVMPVSPDFIKGVFYGGCILFDDMEYVEVDAEAERYVPNPLFIRTLITVRFRLKPNLISQDLDAHIDALQPGSVVELNPKEVESLIWRFKGLRYRKALDEAYYNDINTILTDAIIESQRVSKELAQHRTHLEELVKNQTKDLEQQVIERQQAGDALRASEAQLLAILESTASGILAVDNYGQAQKVNRRFAELWRIPSALIASDDTWAMLSYVLEQVADPDAFQSNIQKLYGTTASETTTVLFKDGRVYERYSTPMIIDGSVNGRVWSYYDITDRIRSEEELKRYRDHLEELVQERTDQLERSNANLFLARDAAEAANQSKSAFLAHMSHELRTPMNIITGMCHLVQRTQLDSRQKRYLQHIETASGTLLELINDILDLSKIEAGKLRIESAPFALEDMIDSMVKIQGLRAEEKALEFNILIQPDVPRHLLGDALRLGQICSNLVSNAIKFTEHGEVVLRVSNMGQQDNTVNLRFEVSDTGVGMVPDFMARIFQPFEQEDDSTTRRFGGSGLGLSISKGLVEMMGGKIGVASETGKGSTFWFELTYPLIRSFQLVEHVPLPTKLKVLVVDDNTSTQEILQSMLESLDYQVDIVGSGEAAIAALLAAKTETGNHSYDLVLMDWRMPGLDGIETTRRIRTDNTLSKVPIIIMVTAYSGQELQDSAARIGMDGFLSKPVTTSNLYDAIQNALSQRPELMQRGFCTKVSDHSSLAGLNVLMVEDNAINREILAEMLTAVGVEYTEAEHGKMAWQHLQTFQFDVVLMDIEMPQMNGLELTRRIRTETRFSDLPIILMTAHGIADIQDSMFETGANDTLDKPIKPNDLFSVLKKWDRRASVPVYSSNFSGSRVLVVDDTTTNRFLLREMLEHAGIEVVEAEDGRAGIELAINERFDLVLMDIQMPVMDGLEATQRIRADARSGQLPIIAVTAHALADDREKSLAAGMNDHLTKPIDPRQLYRLLGKYLCKKDGKPVAQNMLEARVTLEDVPLPDNSVHLDVDWGLEHVMGNRLLLRKLLLRFLQEHTQSHEKLADALLRQDLNTLSQTAHSLAGVAGGIGARDLFEKARQLESLAERQDAKACGRLLVRVGEAHRAVIDILTQFQASMVPEPTAKPQTAIAQDSAAVAMAALAHRLDHGSSRALKYNVLLERGALGPDNQGHLQGTQRLIQAFDFDGALSQLRAFVGSQALEWPEHVAENKLRHAEDRFAAGDIDGGIRVLEDLLTKPENY